MGNPVKAEATVEHFVTVVSPTLVATPFGQRKVPTVPTITLDKSVSVAAATRGNSAPLFLKHSVAVDPLIGVFVPGEYLPFNPVEFSFATSHGHIGEFFPISGTPAPAALNTGVLTGPHADCSAAFEGLIQALAEQIAGEFRNDPLRFLYQFDRSSRAAAQARLAEYAERTRSWMGRAWDWTKGAAGSAWDWTKGAASSTWNYVSSGAILDDAVAAGGWAINSAGSAWNYVSSDAILHDIARGAISAAEGAQALYEFTRDLPYAEILDACKEWLHELFKEFECDASAALAELMADPSPMSEKLGELYGTAKAEATVVAAQVGAAIAADVLVTKGAASAASRLGTMARMTAGRLGSLSDKIGDRIEASRNRPAAANNTPDPAPAAAATRPPASNAPSGAAATTARNDSVPGRANGGAAVACLSCP